MTQIPTGLTIAKPSLAETQTGNLSLPISLSTKPMEAEAVDELPREPGWLFEPKYDGFRCLAFREGERVELRSKKQKSLNRYFPELVAGLTSLEADRFVLDCEIVIPGQTFETLQLRLHPAASRVAELSGKFPARLIVFDILAEGSVALVDRPFSERRAALKEFVEANGQHRVVMLSEAVRSHAAALKWLTEGRTGPEGIVAKRLDQPYRPGERSMQKYKVWRTVDAVLAGYYQDDATGMVESLLFGLYDEGLLHFVGYSRVYHDALEIEKLLEPLKGGAGFTGRRPGGRSRWSGKVQKIMPLEPRLVAELSADHISDGRFRHGSRLIRWRTDKAPEDCGMDQVR